jgi:hypothetical protein
MAANAWRGEACVEDPDDLPPPQTIRWVASRKAQVVTAVQQGRLSIDEACARYGLSLEEFLAWEQALSRHGAAGLRVTRLQDYRG